MISRIGLAFSLLLVIFTSLIYDITRLILLIIFIVPAMILEPKSFIKFIEDLSKDASERLKDKNNLPGDK